MYSYNATVTRIIDGDTVEMVIDLGFRMTFKDRFRLAGINCPEKNTEAGQKAIELLNLALGPLPTRSVSVTTTKPDKYGRWLAELWTEGSTVSINQWLVLKGAAVPWDGKGERP